MSHVAGWLTVMLIVVVSVGARPRKQRRGDVADLRLVADGHLERHAAADGQWVKVKPWAKIPTWLFG